MEIETILSIIGLVILLYTLKTVSSWEWTDIKCPHGPDTKDRSLCKEGNGKNYNGSQPNKTDTTRILLDKINIAGTAVKKDVLWRKAFMYASIASILIFLLALRKFPELHELFLTTLLIMLVIYFGNNYYNYHHYSHIENNIKDTVNILKSRLKYN